MSYAIRLQDKAILAAARSWLHKKPPSKVQIETDFPWFHNDFSLKGGCLRREFIKEFSFAVPCAEAINAITRYSHNLLEVGAGTGYWSALLSTIVPNILACDFMENDYGQTFGVYHTVIKAKAEGFIRQHPDHDVLMCWPNYRDVWSSLALRAMASGRIVFFISEGPGGCVGNDNTFRRLERDFDELERVRIPQWSGMHDYLSIHRKKG